MRTRLLCGQGCGAQLPEPPSPACTNPSVLRAPEAFETTNDPRQRPEIGMAAGDGVTAVCHAAAARRARPLHPVGPRGPRGPRGPHGPHGPRGPRGPHGPRWSHGPHGAPAALRCRGSEPGPATGTAPGSRALESEHLHNTAGYLLLPELRQGNEEAMKLLNLLGNPAPGLF